MRLYVYAETHMSIDRHKHRSVISTAAHVCVHMIVRKAGLDSRKQQQNARAPVYIYSNSG